MGDSDDVSDTTDDTLEEIKRGESGSSQGAGTVTRGHPSGLAGDTATTISPKGYVPALKPLVVTAATPELEENAPKPTSSEVPVRFKVEVFDLHRLELSEPYHLNVLLPRSSSPQMNRAYARKYIHLVPDAFALGVGTHFTRGPHWEGQSPTGSFVIAQVSHPSGFRRWDYQLSIGSELILDVLEHELFVTSTSDDPMDGDPQIRYRRLGGGIGANVDLHTPLGALRLGVAAGGLIIDATEPSTTEASGAFGIRVRHTVFLTEALFAQFAFDRDSLSVKLGEFKVHEIASVKLHLGMYWPGIEGWLRSWL